MDVPPGDLRQKRRDNSVAIIYGAILVKYHKNVLINLTEHKEKKLNFHQFRFFFNK